MDAEYESFLGRLGDLPEAREDSPVDPLLVASSLRQGDGVVEPLSDGSVMAFGKSLMPGKDSACDASMHMDGFVDTTLV
jgi:hypothetical protein